MKYFNKIDGERVYLSPINPEDYKIYTKWINDPDVSRNIGSNHQNFSLTKEKEFLEIICKNDTNFAIIAKDSGLLIGNIGTHTIHEVNRNCEIGIFIGDSEYRGKGYGSEALSIFMDHMFNQINMNSISLLAFEYNKRAIKCYEKLGFKLVGKMRQNKYLDGEYHDTLIMDILKSEFNKK